ncbi:MAG: PLP-dependent aminotransferase family protein [Dokdonella sp.]|uniref:aminotransferase-like domain-containing protein n=1 Tax=Dokdonella sp. TaxID=2291710 RepID=UPI003F7E06B2
MRRWELAVSLDPQGGQPLFLQLADAIAGDMRRGRLRAGDALPGSRELAAQLGLNRNPVVAAYEELAAQGSVRTRVGGGTFVAAATPLARVRPWTPEAPAAPTFALAPAAPARVVAPAAPAPGTLLLAGAAPDPRLFPARALARAFRRAIEARGRAALGAGGPCGHARLRGALADMLARSRGLPATPANTMVTRSIEQGIDLVARALVSPGDVVAVEQLGYPPAWNALRLAGAEFAPLPLDGEGLRVDALAALLERTRVRAVFLTPHHQFPTTAVMSAARRARLAELALRHRIAIIEDDYDHEFHYAGKPVLPLAAGPGGANAVSIGSLSNLLAPGLVTGFVVAPTPVFERIAQLRAASDPRCDAALEAAIAELFEDGELLRHVRRLKRAFAARRDALATALRRRLGGALEFHVAEGGLALWVRADAAIDLGAWVREGLREGVQFAAATPYEFSGRDVQAMRLAFSWHDEAELGQAVERMARALTRCAPRRRAPLARAASGTRAIGSREAERRRSA